jgi:hypothetical protein
LLSTGTRLLTFVIPVVWISQCDGFVIEDVWLLSVTTTSLQAVVSYLLLRREFGQRLNFPGQTAAAEG